MQNISEERVPSHLFKCSTVIGSSFGGSSCTATFGSNLPVFSDEAVWSAIVCDADSVPESPFGYEDYMV
jgi:hypothetical protein